MVYKTEITRENIFYINMKVFDELSKKKGNVAEDYYVTYKGRKARVFTREMDLILTAKELPLMGEGAHLWQRGIFLKDYVFGFKDGEVFFDKGYDKKELFKINHKVFVKNLYHLCYKSFKKRNTGFIYFIKNYPSTINKEMVYQFGYYSGILNRIEQVRAQNKELFDKYFNDKDD